MLMKIRAALVALVVPIAVLAAAPAGAHEPPAPPPYVDHAEWAHWGDQSSLRVYPTSSGRGAAAQIGTGVGADEAWSEVLAVAPKAGLPGMRAQFVCHWKLAEFATPGKTSWNLEPWRPVVDATEMIAAGCNPGGGVEPF